MIPITYLGGLHGDLAVVGQDDDGPVLEADVYRSFDSAGQPIHLELGETVEVDADTAARLAEDHAPFFEIDGKVAPKTDSGEKSIDDMTGAELDEHALKLGVADWNVKAKVADKKQTLKAHVTAGAEARAALVATDRDELNAAAAELGIDSPADLDLEPLVDAILAKQAADDE